MKIQTVTGILLACWLTGTVNAMFMQPRPLPIERVARNTHAYVANHPDDPEGYYILGRIYYLGFINQATYIPGFDEGEAGEQPRIAPDWLLGGSEYLLIQAEAEKRALQQLELSRPPANQADENRDTYYTLVRNYSDQLREEKWQPTPIAPEAALAYAVEAKQQFLKAIEMDKKKALYRLGLASLYEQAADFTVAHELESSAFSGVDRDLLLDTYWEAFDLSRSEDAGLEYRPVSGLPSLVSYEAGKAWIRLGGTDEKKAEAIGKQLDQLGQLKMGAITPLVITPPSVSSPSGFVLPDIHVMFDLDGEGHAEPWEWITPETGLLVWDPLDQRRITSGVQLFGNYTFQIIWSDGFRALAALDNNGDQSITGAELEGLSVWYDHNTNGSSEPSEVTPVRQLGILSLSYRDVITSDGMRLSKQGVTYTDGSRAHLWDWISFTEE